MTIELLSDTCVSRFERNLGLRFKSASTDWLA